MSEQQAEQQADATAMRVAALLALYEANRLETPDFARAAAVAVFAGKLVGSRLADIQISTHLNEPPVGVAPGRQHLVRIEEAVMTVLDDADDEEPALRLERLSRSEVLLSHRASLIAAMREQGVTQWRRVVQSDACEVCEPLAGEVKSTEEGFKDHPGCHCSAEPVDGAHSASEAVLEAADVPARPLVTITRTTA